MEKVARIGWELLSHPPHSQDFVPSEFHLFGLLKESLKGLKLNENQDVQQHTFWTSSASLTEMSEPRASWRLVKRWERWVNLWREILLKSGKNHFLLATVVFLKEIVQELIERPSYFTEQLITDRTYVLNLKSNLYNGRCREGYLAEQIDNYQYWLNSKLDCIINMTQWDYCRYSYISAAILNEDLLHFSHK